MVFLLNVSTLIRSVTRRRNTAKRGVRVQAKGQGRIILRATSANNKDYLLQVDAFHVPELASNLLSVYYLCNRGYKVVYAIPT